MAHQGPPPSYQAATGGVQPPQKGGAVGYQQAPAAMPLQQVQYQPQQGQQVQYQPQQGQQVVYVQGQQPVHYQQQGQQPQVVYVQQQPQQQQQQQAGFLDAPSAGIVIRQHQQGAELLQAVGLPLEIRNIYDIFDLPPQFANPDGWSPRDADVKALRPIGQAQEESDSCLRCVLACCGGLNLRELKMHVRGTQNRDELLIDRPCMCGLAACYGLCCPLQMHATDAHGRYIGQVRESCSCTRCCECLCCCVVYSDIHVNGAVRDDGPPRQHMGGPNGVLAPAAQLPTSQLHKKYSTRVGLCCSPRYNCCGATCCNSELTGDILDAQGRPVAMFQKHYAAGGSGTDSACCRCLNQASTYSMQFPPGATAVDRKLLFTSIMQVDYQLFEKKGGDQG